MTPLLTAKEAAARLAITVDQLSGLVADGDFAYIVVGRGLKRPRRRFTEEDIEAFIERRRRRDVFLPPSSKRRSTTSGSLVVGFSALLNADLARKRKSSKP